jgi:hypothetical protein
MSSQSVSQATSQSVSKQSAIVRNAQLFVDTHGDWWMPCCMDACDFALSVAAAVDSSRQHSDIRSHVACGVGVASISAGGKLRAYAQHSDIRSDVACGVDVASISAGGKLRAYAPRCHRTNRPPNSLPRRYTAATVLFFSNSLKNVTPF